VHLEPLHFIPISAPLASRTRHTPTLQIRVTNTISIAPVAAQDVSQQPCFGETRVWAARTSSVWEKYINSTILRTQSAYTDICILVRRVFSLYSMAHIKNPSLGQLDWFSALDRLDWYSELPLRIQQLKELRDEIGGRQEFADGVAYDSDIQNCLQAFNAFIKQRTQSLRRPEWRLQSRMRDAEWSNAEWSNAESPETESPETELHETELHEYETLESISEKCHTASFQFLRKPGKHACKELDAIVQLMEELYGKSTDGDVGLGSLGAQGENGLVGADVEGPGKPPCQHDAGLELGSLEHGIELITLHGHGC